MNNNNRNSIENASDSASSPEGADYDALNGETFGNDQDDTDWEASHENWVIEYCIDNNDTEERRVVEAIDDRHPRGEMEERRLVEAANDRRLRVEAIKSVKEIEDNLKREFLWQSLSALPLVENSIEGGNEEGIRNNNSLEISNRLPIDRSRQEIYETNQSMANLIPPNQEFRNVFPLNHPPPPGPQASRGPPPRVPRRLAPQEPCGPRRLAPQAPCEPPPPQAPCGPRRLAPQAPCELPLQAPCRPRRLAPQAPCGPPPQASRRLVSQAPCGPPQAPRGQHPQAPRGPPYGAQPGPMLHPQPNIYQGQVQPSLPFPNNWNRPPMRYEYPQESRGGRHHNQSMRQPSHGRQHSASSLPAPNPPVDEYAGMMSMQEKQWLISIQILQLNTNEPHNDYYYNAYMQRHQGQSSRKTNNRNLPNTRVVTYSRQPTRYVPVQFENSLGKLQAGSVTAPRKIIDTVAPSSSTETTEDHPERKTLKLQREIETFFQDVMRIEESLSPLPSKSPAEAEESLQTRLDAIMDKLFMKGKLVSVLSVRKGKQIVLRLIAILENPAELVHQLLVDLMPISRRDVDEMLLCFLPAIRTYLSSVDLPTIVQIVKYYDTEYLMFTKFTISVMANVINRAADVLHQCDDEDILQEWKQFILRLILSTKYCMSNERAVVAVDPNLVYKQLSLVQGLFDQKQADKLLRAIAFKSHPPDNKEHN